MTADGGAEVVDHNAQEREMLPLLRAEVDAALRVLRTGGHLVLKVFDAFSDETKGVLRGLHANFERFSLIKPHSSRPANSERYAVCMGRLESPRQECPDFDARLRDLNVRCARRQVQALRDTFRAIRDPNLLRPEQAELARRWLRAWGVGGRR